MNIKKKKKYSLEGDATFKQGWKIANTFASQLEENYPQYDHQQLTRLINGAIYYYHQSICSPMTKAEASDIISNDLSCPKYYIDHLNNFLNNPKEFIDNTKPTEGSNDSQVPNSKLLIDIANFPRGESD